MPSYRRKYVRKISYVHPVLGRTCFRLINLLTGQEITPYSAYLIDRIQSSNKKSPKHSVSAWADDLSCFFDYFVAASDYLAKHPEMVVSSALSDVIFGYPHYLIDGVNSENALVCNTAKMTEGGGLEKSTAARRISSLRSFITASANTQIALQGMKKLGRRGCESRNLRSRTPQTKTNCPEATSGIGPKFNARRRCAWRSQVHNIFFL